MAARIAPSSISYSFLLGFLLTLFSLRWYGDVPIASVVWLGLLICTCVCIAMNMIRKTLVISLAISTIIGTAAACFIFSQNLPDTESNHITQFAHRHTITIEGMISKEPDRRPMQTKYIVNVTRITIGTKDYETHGRVLVTDRRLWPEFSYGDIVRITGKLEVPEAFDDFAYDKYLRIFDVSTIMTAQYIDRMASGKGNAFMAFLYQLKYRFEYQINRIFAEPHASFLAGLLTGSRKGIPDHLTESFNITGLTHIIAISGYNITIIIAIIGGMFFWLPFRWRFAPMVIAIIAFTIFVGASASVVRAAIMGILGLIALQLGRQSQVRLLTLWTAAVMAAWNPYTLWYDAGFQLSFLAVIGLMELSPFLMHWLRWIPDVLELRTALAATLASQIATLPLIIFLFGRLSLIAPIANVLATPFIPIAMLFGFVGTIVSIVFFPLGQAICYISWLCMEWIVLVATYGATLPFAAVNL